jgi:GxxExxY protein
MAQLLSYLKATKLKVGLLTNFAKGTLKIKRVVN